MDVAARLRDEFGIEDGSGAERRPADRTDGWSGRLSSFVFHVWMASDAFASERGPMRTWWKIDVRTGAVLDEIDKLCLPWERQA